MTRLMRLLFITAFVLLACACWSSRSFAFDLQSAVYDDDIQAAVKRYMRPFQDWKFLKAQYYQESRFDTNAESPVGAKGIAQFMPATWQDVSKQLGWSWVDPHEAKYSIQAGAYYMNQLRNFPDWRDWLDPDRLRMSQAAYNAGAGNIRKALRLCSAVTYEVVAMCLPQITGNHSQETITYVQRIQKYRDRLQ